MRHPKEVFHPARTQHTVAPRRAVMRRLLLVRHASTDAVRAVAFGADEPLDAGGRAAAARLRLSRADEVLVSLALRTRETASAAGLAVSGEDAALAECDFGRWAGLTLRDVVERE